MKVAGSNFGYHKFEFVNGHFHWGFNDYQGIYNVFQIIEIKLLKLSFHFL